MLQLGLGLGKPMSDDEWYWLEGKQSRGPTTKVDLENLFHRKEVRRETLIWRPGQDRWKQIVEIWPSIDQQPPPLPNGRIGPQPPSQRHASVHDQLTRQRSQAQDAKANIGRDWSDSTGHPWRRYFARMLDITVNGSLTFFAIGLVLAMVDPNAPGRVSSFFSNRIVGAMVTVAASIPLNALLIGLTGGTLGKWLFGVRVLDSQGAPMGFGAALSREIAVWIQGLAFGIPIVSLFTLFSEYKTLVAVGSTSWDSTRTIFVVHRPMGARQVIGATIGVLTWLCVIIVLQAL